MGDKTETRSGSQGRSARKIKNFLLMPSIQIRLGAYMVVLAILLLASLVSIVYVKMGEIVSLIVQLTDVEDEVEEVLLNYVQDMSWWILLTISLYIAINLTLSVWYTHKMIGPTYAFRRHVKALGKGEFFAKTILRKGDAFEELAQDLNDLSDTLAGKDEGGKPPSDDDGSQAS